MRKIIKYFNMRFFCNHNLKSVEDSEWWFHEKCSKCGFEKGFGLPY